MSNQMSADAAGRSRTATDERRWKQPRAPRAGARYRRGRLGEPLRRSRNRRLVGDAERNVLDVDAVDTERLQEEPLLRCRRRVAERLEAQRVHRVDVRLSGRLEEEQIGLDDPRPDEQRGREDFIDRAVAREAIDRAD